MAAPFLSPDPNHIQPSRENTRRGHELLDNALSFRMPGAFAGRPRFGDNGNAAHNGGAGVGAGKGALQAIDGNSPPRSTPASPPRGRGRSAAGAGAKRGRGARRGRLGAVKLEITPPKSRSDYDSGGDGSLPSSSAATSGGRGRSQAPSPATPPSPHGEEAGCGGDSGGGNFLRRMSSSMSPPRRGLAGAFARVLPFGAAEKEHGASPRRAVANPNPPPVAAAAAAAAGAAATAPRRRGGVTEGSRIDLRGLDRAKGGNQPRAYHCKDRSVVVLGRERMLSVLPDNGDSGLGDSGLGGGGGGGAGGGAGSGVVTWVLRYTELESCCINVSAGKESECSVGDVIVEVTTRCERVGPPSPFLALRVFFFFCPTGRDSPFVVSLCQWFTTVGWKKKLTSPYKGGKVLCMTYVAHHRNFGRTLRGTHAVKYPLVVSLEDSPRQKRPFLEGRFTITSRGTASIFGDTHMLLSFCRPRTAARPSNAVPMASLLFHPRVWLVRLDPPGLPGKTTPPPTAATKNPAGAASASQTHPSAWSSCSRSSSAGSLLPPLLPPPPPVLSCPFLLPLLPCPPLGAAPTTRTPTRNPRPPPFPTPR